MLALTSNADEGAPPDSYLINSGREIYQQYCAACHGAAAEGAPNWKKPNDQGEMPPPPHGPEGHTWRHSDAMLQRMISQGWRDPFNKTQRLTMPAFQKELPPKEIAAVITYLKTLWTTQQRQFQRQESQARSPNPSQSQLLEK
ncbi:MAG: cytochrome c [Amphritea sp.]